MRTDGISDADLRLQMDEGVKDLKRQLRQTKQMLDDYKKAHGSIKVQFDLIKDAINELPPPKPVNIVKTKKTKAETPVDLCMLFSDWHYGAIQNKSEIEEFGEFSPEICEQRLEGCVGRIIDWVSLHRNSYTVDNAHILVLGDLISGDIHQELQVTNAFPSPVQSVGAATLLSKLVSETSRHFKRVVVHFITEDNHARLTKKPQAKEAGMNTFNYIVGMIAKISLSRHSNVEFNVYPQYEAVVRVGDRKYLLMHGHNMPPGLVGVSWYGIERKVMKEALTRLNMDEYKRFHKVIMGHWHVPISTPHFWIGGSVSGTDAYDHKNGRYAKASQSAWMVHGKYGEFDRTDFVLE